MKKPRRARVHIFEPVGVDLWDRRANQPDRGTRVVLTQPHGAPRNGTMGHVYVKDADTGAFYGLVLRNSLRPTNEFVIPRDLAAEAREARSRSYSNARGYA